MLNPILSILCLVLLLSSPVKAGYSPEEMKEIQKKLIDREMKLQEARQEKMSQAVDALQKKDFDQVIRLASDIIYEYRLKGPAKAEVLALRSAAYFHKGDLAKAKEDVNTALIDNNKEARAYLIRSTIYEKEGRSDLAIADMESYLQQKPGDQAGKTRLNGLKGTTSATSPSPPPPAPEKSAPKPSPEPAPIQKQTQQTAVTPAIHNSPPLVNQPESEPKLLLAESSDKAFSLRKPADWVINEDLRPDSLRITVVSPDHTSAVDYLWLPNPTGQINALKALAAYQQRLVPGSAKIEWNEVYKTDDHSKATATMKYHSPALALEGKFYMEASATSLSLQGYMVPEGQLTQKRQLLYNIMASLVFSKEPVPKPKSTEPIAPQYANIPLVNQVAQDKSVTMSTPKDWGFLAARGRALTSADNGSQGFTFLTFDGNPILKGATVAQGVIAQPYIPPDQTIKTILAGFGHKNIIIKNTQKDAKARQEFMHQIGRNCDAQDMTVTWTSSKGASCLGFFKIINAAPSPTGLWFSLLAGIWGPQQDFYKYFPMLEQVAASFSVNDQYARRYIQDGLANARALHDKTVKAIQENSILLEQKQKDWENRQKIKDFSDSKWDDHWRGKSYWVSEMESGKVYEATNYGLQDTRTGTFHEGSGFTYTNFKGQSPVHPSETMTEVPRATMEKLLVQ